VAVYAENTGASFHDALQAPPGASAASEHPLGKAIGEFVELLDDLRGLLAVNLGELVEAVLELTALPTEA